MSLLAFLNSRLETLEGHLASLLALLKEYELAIMFEDNPRRRMNYAHGIEQVRESAGFYRQEYDELQQELRALTQAQTPTPLEDEPLRLLGRKIDRMQNTLLGELRLMRADVLEEYDAGEQALVAAIIDHFDQSQLLLMDELAEIIGQDRLDEAELGGLARLLQEALQALPPASLPQQEEVRKVLADPQMGMSHKLKISLPIIPAILSYEGEVQLDQKANLVDWVKGHLPKKKDQFPK